MAESYDALVIGAGAGGLAAAARLQHLGYRTVLIECRDRVGGRASTTEVGDFTVNTGALVFELGGENSRLFDDLGVDSGVQELDCPLTLRIEKRAIPLMSGSTGAAFRWVVGGLRLVSGKVSRLRPSRGVDTETWMRTLRAGSGMQSVVRSLCSSFFAAQPKDVDAALFFDFLVRPRAAGLVGAHPDGAIGPWRALAEHFQRQGGELWLGATVESLTVDGAGLVSGAVVTRGAERTTVAATIVVSDVGPPLTVKLCGDAAPAGWADEVGRSPSGTLITINFASRVPMSNFHGLVVFGKTRRLAYGGNLNTLSPKIVPDGFYVYACAGTPDRTMGNFTLDAEVELLTHDLREIFPEFDSAHILSVEVTSAEANWPAQWAISGHGSSRTTPFANLWNVGDGVYEWGSAGQSGCVETARLVVEQIQREYPATVSG